MHADLLLGSIPLDRYRRIIACLASERDSWNDSVWLRFAAQAAVLSDEDGAVIAVRIRQVATLLSEQAGWYQELAGPTRFVIATMLILYAVPLDEFLADQLHGRGLLEGVGLRHDGFHQTMAVLILGLQPGCEPLLPSDAERLKAIYEQMKRFHWWLTGPADLPACAALSQRPGAAMVVVANVEDAYQQLRKAGLASGDHLRTAACLMVAAGLATPVAVRRYRDLRDRLEQELGKLYPEHYDAVAVLSMLEQAPEVVVARLAAVHRELDLLQPDLVGTPNFVIASDLVFLDLVRYAADMTHPRAGARLAEIRRAHQAFHTATLVLLSQMEPGTTVPATVPALAMGGIGWPYSYG